MGENCCAAQPPMQASLDGIVEAIMGQVERGSDLQNILVTLLEDAKPQEPADNIKNVGYPSTLEGVLQYIFQRLVSRNDDANELLSRVEKQIGHFKLLP